MLVSGRPPVLEAGGESLLRRSSDAPGMCSSFRVMHDETAHVVHVAPGHSAPALTPDDYLTSKLIMPI